MNIRVVHILMLLLFPIVGISQLSTHWSESFSTKSALLSGAVVGGYQDESSIYYNPSILSDSSVNQFSFANGLAKVELIRYDNAMGPGLDVSNDGSTVDPGFISVNLYPKRKYGLVWKAALFNKSRYDNGFFDEYKYEDDIFPVIPGNESYLGRIDTRTEYNDYWYGLGVAKFLNERFSLGFSFFARYSSLTYTSNKLIEVSGFGSGATFDKVLQNNESIFLKGFTWRGTVKIGANYRLNDQVKVGMVITAPSFSIRSSATAVKNITYINVPDKNSGELLPDYLYDASADDLEMKIKDPLSIALGVDFDLDKYRWNLTTEWFAPIAPYKMVNESTGDVTVTKSNPVVETPDYLSFANGGNSIMNVAIGLEKFSKNNQSWLFGFKTDFDALKDYDYEELSELNKLANAKSNYYHFSAGKSFVFLNFDVLFGLQYSLSRQGGLEAFANFKAPLLSSSEEKYSLEGPIENNMKFYGDAIVVFVGLTLKK